MGRKKTMPFFQYFIFRLQRYKNSSAKQNNCFFFCQNGVSPSSLMVKYQKKSIIFAFLTFFCNFAHKF